jgi:hypothetical protein
MKVKTKPNDTKSLNYKPEGISMIIMKSKQIFFSPSFGILLPL